MPILFFRDSTAVVIKRVGDNRFCVPFFLTFTGMIACSTAVSSKVVALQEFPGRLVQALFSSDFLSRSWSFSLKSSMWRADGRGFLHFYTFSFQYSPLKYGFSITSEAQFLFFQNFLSLLFSFLVK